MKKIIYIFGILFLIMIVILNILFTANLSAEEHIELKFNSFIYIIGLVLLGIFIYFFCKKINKKIYSNSKEKEKTRKYLTIGAFSLYIMFNIIWALLVNPKVVGDSVHVCNLAQTFKRGNLGEFLPKMTYANISLKEYMQAYPHQITLAFIYSIVFRIIHFDIMELLRILNIMGNIAIVIALYKINTQLSKTYKTNKVLLLVLILTFISLPMLVTFIYGDIPSLALCLFAVYFMMKYTETKKIKYPIMSSIFTMIAYMMRMNTLIFIIATTIYLLLNMFKELSKTNWKENLFKLMVIIVYIATSIVPSILVQNYYFKKYDLDKNRKYPIQSYLLMAMEESERGYGWYNEEIGEKALKNPKDVKGEYIQQIKKRLSYLVKNIGYTFKFYTIKIASMWTENTYSAVRNNKEDGKESIEKMIKPLTFYQKVLLLLISFCSFIVIIQNRKKLSLDVIFLITIFIGGFTFHMLWEAKSRYIIPYIVILIPIASINFNRFNSEHIRKIHTLYLEDKKKGDGAKNAEIKK